VDEEAERLQRKTAPTAEKTSPEFIDVEATYVKAPTTEESGESTNGEATSDGGRGSNKDDSGKKGRKSVFRSSDVD
jgi:hypothetical protein